MSLIDMQTGGLYSLIAGLVLKNKYKSAGGYQRAAENGSPGHLFVQYNKREHDAYNDAELVYRHDL